MKIKTYISILLVTSFVCATPIIYSQEPWRLDAALNTPEWLYLSGSHRSRFETLDGQFRGARNGGDQAFLMRTLLKAKVSIQDWQFVAEMQDSRSEFDVADSGTPLSTSVVNPFELLQAYVAMPLVNSQLRVGRFTMDVGSRRLVARNRFRNTLNNFTGLDWQWQSKNKQQLRLFYTLPVQRLVEGNILDNKSAFDKQDDEVVFWGAYYHLPTLSWGDNAEVYWFALDEDDSLGRATSNRDIYTIGFRLYRKAKTQKFDYQIESVYQFGDSRSSRTATTDLEHKAHFQHIELGYSFQHSWNPRLVLQYDYASGDESNTDNDNNRFSTLFGARRFDFGPTSIYGPFARANISTPGLRLQIKPKQNVKVFFALRSFWLASNNDAWTTASIRNAASNNDSYIGTQIETRLRWDVLPKSVRLEAGAAHIFAGDLMKNAAKGDSSYAYSQIVFTF